MRSAADHPRPLEPERHYTIDISGLVHAFMIYAQLRDDPDLFGKLRIGESGVDIVCNDTIHIAKGTLWRNRAKS